MHRQALKPAEVPTKSQRNPKKSPIDLAAQATTQSEPTPTSKGKKTKVVTPKAPAVIETTPRKTRAKAERETAAPLGSSTMSTAIQAKTVVAPKKTQKPQSKPKPVVSPPPGFMTIPDPAYGQTRKWWDECDKHGFKYESNFTPEASKDFLKRSAFVLKWDHYDDRHVRNIDMEIMLPTTLTANAETNFSHLALGNANKFYDDSNSIKISVHDNYLDVKHRESVECKVDILHIPTDIQNEMEKILGSPCGDSFSLFRCGDISGFETYGDTEEFAALMTVLRYRPTASGEFNHYINIDLESLLLVSYLHLGNFSYEVEEYCEDMKPSYLGIIDGGNTTSGDSDDSDDDSDDSEDDKKKQKTRYLDDIDGGNTSSTK